MRIEEIVGWLKTIAQLRKTRHRGTARVEWRFIFGLAASTWSACEIWPRNPDERDEKGAFAAP
jgi:hypothetical protein